MPVTIRQIAVEAGVSKTTVGKVLNHQSRVADSTRSRVLAVAKRLGYRDDARLTMLMSYLRRAHSARGAVNLAWLTYADNPLRPNLAKIPWAQGFWTGALRRAELAGFVFDEIWLRDPKLKSRRVADILKARGVEGLLLFGPDDLLDYPHLPWDDYPAVVIGARLWPRNYHRASYNLFRGMQLVTATLRRRGFKRIGLWWGTATDSIADRAVSAAFFSYQHGLSPKDRVPWIGDGDASALLKWWKQHRPQVILCGDNQFLKKCARINLSVPRDVSVVHLNICTDVAGWAGLNRCHEEIGAAAIDMLAGQLNRGERGEPEHSRETLLPGVWVDGFTLGEPAKR